MGLFLFELQGVPGCLWLFGYGWRGKSGSIHSGDVVLEVCR